MVNGCRQPQPDNGELASANAVEEDYDDALPEGVCSAEATLCGQSVEDCVDLSASLHHCGACGNRCFSNQACDDGVCTGVGILTVAQLKEALESKDFKLINVRVPPIGTIPGTDHTIAHNRLEKLVEAIGPDRDTRVVLYCGTSVRIRVALQLLQDKGYRNVSVLETGIRGWMAEGNPVL